MDNFVRNVDETAKSMLSELDAYNPDTGEEEEEEAIEVLTGNGKNGDEIISNLKKYLAIASKDRSEPFVYNFENLTQSSLASHGLAAYVSGLDLDVRRRFLARVTSQTTGWLLNIFKFYEGACFLNEDPLEGLLRVTRLQLLSKYPKYATDGYEALYTSPPTLYVSSACKPTLGHYLCVQLGLPLSSLRIFDTGKDSLLLLDKLLQEDIGARKTPVMVISCLGSNTTGQMDDLTFVRKTCQQNNVWLHLEGQDLAALCLMTNLNPTVRVSDSLACNFGKWLGVPGLPHLTLYQSCEPNLLKAAGLLSLVTALNGNCVPVWITFQLLGMEGIMARLQNAIEMALTLVQKLSSVPNIKFISHRTPDLEASPSDLLELITKNPSPILSLSSLPSLVVVFQYKVPVEASSNQDDMNLWLAQVLERTVPEITLEIMDVKDEGYALRFSPLDGKNLIAVQDMENLLECLEQQFDVLDATVEHKFTLSELVKSMEELDWVELPGWAGLGGVRFLPENVRNIPAAELTDQAKQDINLMNLQLVEKLKSTDSAFSVGEGEDGLYCVRFGMVVKETDVSELAHLVRGAGLELEASQQALNTMAILVRQGIEKAQEELQKESEQELWQQGLLRHIPVVGSLVNWLSPPSRGPGIKGRTLDLQDGRIENTEKIYQKVAPKSDSIEPASQQPASEETNVMQNGDIPDQ